MYSRHSGSGGDCCHRCYMCPRSHRPNCYDGEMQRTEPCGRGGKYSYIDKALNYSENVRVEAKGRT